MEKIIAGLVQMDSGPDMNENMRMAEQYVREAAEQGEIGRASCRERV